MTYKNNLFSKKRKAFTLIELLIVIAIIGILFIVLVSKVDFAADKAKATGVQTDFRSFQMALETVSKEKAGFNIFGWNTGDANANGVRDSVDEGDANEDGVYRDGETWTGHKKYLETWTNKYSLIKPGTTFAADGYDKDAIFALETAINKNLDPKLHITIDAKTGLITMANGAQDPWNTQYHGAYISAEDGMDRGAIVMYSNGANQKFGSEHSIANGVVTITVPGNNKLGADDYSLVVCYTYTNGYGEVGALTTGFSNNQTFLTGNGANNQNNSEELMECGHAQNTPGDHTKRDCGHYNCQNADCTCETVPCGITGHWTGDGLDHSSKHGDHFKCQCNGWVVPEGCTYYVGVTSNQLGNHTGATTIYNAGDVVPCGSNPQKGDVLTSNDYEYKYQYAYDLSLNQWYTNGALYSWAVRVLDATKTEYEPILESINTQPIVKLDYTFAQCTSLIFAPEIPSGTTTMLRTFFGCTNLIAIPRIPYGVNRLSGAFEECTSLVDLSDLIIPNSVQYMDSAFDHCTSLTTAPVIPSSVVNLTWTFSGCTSLIGTVYINTNNVTSNVQSTASGYCGECFRYVDMRNITLSGESSKDILNLIGSTGNNWINIE